MHYQKKPGRASAAATSSWWKDRLDWRRRNDGIRASQLRLDLLWLRSGTRDCDGFVVVASKSQFLSVCSYLGLRRNLGTESCFAGQSAGPPERD